MKSYYQTCAIPKPKPRKAVKAKKDRKDARQLREFQDAVWKREHDKIEFADAPTFARCQDCYAWVNRSSESQAGHVHHMVSRRHKAKRYDPANGRLLCRLCHNAVHGREF